MLPRLGYRPWRDARLGWAITALVLVAGVPLFLCMPPWVDVTLYDVAARNLLHGGVHYRDVFDTNLPGVVWVMAGIRAVFGSSYEVLRAFDLVFVLGAAAVLGRFVLCSGGTRASLAWFAAAVALYYPFTSEFNHCQRDPWMLLPGAIAAWLRFQQLEQPMRFGRAILEGVMWGLAIWLKPHAIVVALFVWFVSVLIVWRSAGWRRVGLDWLGLFLGGAVMGVAGISWLVASGAWPYFWDVFTNWNPEYLSGVWVGVADRVTELFWFFRPWSLLHLVAIPVAVAGLWEAIQKRGFGRVPSTLFRSAETTIVANARGVIAALYLSWLGQAMILQKGFDYVHVPETLLAFAVLAGHGWAVGFVYTLWFAVVGGLLNLADVVPVVAPVVRAIDPAQPAIKFEKHALTDMKILRYWPRCWGEGSTPELRDRLAHYPDIHCATNWEDLAGVANYLRSVDPPLRDRELTCWHDSTHPLYLILNVEPSTRYMHFGTVFPLRGKVVEIRREVANSHQRLIASDLRRMTYSTEKAYAPGETGPLSLPPWFPQSERSRYPWNQPVVFRSGRYLVHRIVHPVMEDEIDIPDWFHLDELDRGN